VSRGGRTKRARWVSTTQRRACGRSLRGGVVPSAASQLYGRDESIDRSVVSSARRAAAPSLSLSC
jgi:hypothetical protein